MLHEKIIHQGIRWHVRHSAQQMPSMVPIFLFIFARKYRNFITNLWEDGMIISLLWIFFSCLWFLFWYPDGSWNIDTVNRTIEGIFTGFEVSLQFKRYPTYYIYNLFLPVSVVSIVGFISVFIPSDSSDRINLCVTVLLGFIFIQSLMTSLVPKVAQAPYVADYVIEAMILSGLNTVFSVIVIGIHHLNSDPPKIVKVLGIHILGVIVCRRENVQKEKRSRSGTNWRK